MASRAPRPQYERHDKPTQSPPLVHHVGRLLPHLPAPAAPQLKELSASNLCFLPNPSLPMRTTGLLSLFLLLILPGCGDTATPSQERRALSTDAAPEAIGPYSQAIQAGSTIYCSGQIGINPQTDSLVKGGIKAETRQALDNLTAVLQAGGASMDDVVQAQVFLADLDDYEAMNEVYSTYFETAPPARAAVEAARLPAGARVEMMMTARK